MCPIWESIEREDWGLRTNPWRQFTIRRKGKYKTSKQANKPAGTGWGIKKRSRPCVVSSSKLHREFLEELNDTLYLWL